LNADTAILPIWYKWSCGDVNLSARPQEAAHAHLDSGRRAGAVRPRRLPRHDDRRTVTVHFPTKEDLLFAADPFAVETLTARIRNRSDEESTLDALRDWMATTMADLSSETPEIQKRVWHQRELRAHVINGDDALRARARAGYYEYEQIIATGIGQDLNQPADSLVPRLAAITAVAGLRELYESREIRERTTPPSTGELLAWVDRVINFIRAGMTCAENPSPRDMTTVGIASAGSSAAPR
jgi:AcrR family transcriptional regulator